MLLCLKNDFWTKMMQVPPINVVSTYFVDKKIEWKIERDFITFLMQKSPTCFSTKNTTFL